MGAGPSTNIYAPSYEFPVYNKERFRVHVSDGTRVLSKPCKLDVTLKFDLEYALPKGLQSEKRNISRLQSECRKLFDGLDEGEWFRRYKMQELGVHNKLAKFRVEVSRSRFSSRTFEISLKLSVAPRPRAVLVVSEVAAHVATTVAWLSEGGGMWAMKTNGRWKTYKNGKPRKWMTDSENEMTLRDIIIK